MTPETYIPEIHDVHPAAFALIKGLLAALPVTVGEKAALTVVPFWRSRWPMDQDEAFCAFLNRHPGEKVLHGYTHWTEDTLWNRFWFGTDNHGEFGRLSTREALTRLAKGCEVYERALGFRPQWFCAPRWRQSPGTGAALAALDFRGYMKRNRCVFFGNRPLCARAIYFDAGHRPWSRWAARLHRQRVIRRDQNRKHPFRLVLHPSDFQDPGIWKQVQSLLFNLEERGWRAVSLEEAFLS